jgi:ppGpp synthetase/RelA/SpoT-type nucleotidyltranferase
MTDAVGRSPSEWGDRYATMRGQYLDCTDAFERLLRQLLDAEGIEVAQLEARTKTVPSFSEKIERKKDKYADPLTEITDLTGLRVILYFQDDVEAVGRLIEREFVVDAGNSPQQGSDLPVDRFGYRSDHYVVSLSAARLGLPEYERFDGRRAEVQVRTVMEHAWSAVDHKIRYKGADLPVDLQRRLFRLKALLEVGDDQFAALRDASKSFVESYERSVTRGELDVELDALSLQAYLDETGAAVGWGKVSESVGFGSVPGGVADPPPSWLEDLLTYLRRGGIERLRELEGLLKSADEWGEDALKIVAQELGSRARGIVNPPELSLLMIVQVAMKDPVAVDDASWMSEVRDALKKAFKVSSYRPPARKE